MRFSSSEFFLKKLPRKISLTRTCRHIKQGRLPIKGQEKNDDHVHGSLEYPLKMLYPELAFCRAGAIDWQPGKRLGATNWKKCCQQTVLSFYGVFLQIGVKRPRFSKGLPPALAGVRRYDYGPLSV
ncbi:unnamed protein product [Arctia plantaginis]|uniref:Uncharacterized protein n=1 Tax=Arctia plantaginis TaxID=874455 RepID=A0A8S0ZNH0_ARCPL|nr:unnamed protein product [Arctia plantaginis]